MRENLIVNSVFRVEVLDDVCVFTAVDGKLMEFERIQQTSQEFDGLMRETDRPTIVVDFQGIRFFNSMSMGLLVFKNTKAKQAGKSLRYCNLSPDTLWALKLTQLDHILNIFPDRAAACQADGGKSAEPASADASPP